ncbi:MULTISPECIES: DUF3822 family protein [Flavobacteriaceae]|uniref:DUF3822 family protein n=2 Tax=Flavobacteriaceae TaxID=49546 RepID=A0A4Y8AX04_9FLAO|nr:MULTISPECIES: DUF3822 family protein [Flavobacteriaceae]TEW77003.1 DUF3822 family protein [Gramella jeungdoensis]GGK58698.1 hypothetical protein GCM10007963_28510 [Lutibacter litoralis]
MIKEIRKITNNSLDYKNLEENHLSIQLSLDGFSFCVYNKPSNSIAVFAKYEFSNTPTPFEHLNLVKQLYSQEALLKLKYTSVNVTHLNNLITQVPLPFFNKEDLKYYLQNTIKVLDNDYITYDEISNSEIVNVYIPFVNINNFLLDIYGTFIFKHSSTVLIETLLNQFKNQSEDYCFVNVSNLNFELVVFKNKKLELFNYFSFKTKEDFIYYILFVAEQLNLDTEEFNLILLGDIERESELYTILYQYIRNIKFYEPKKQQTLVNGISAHANFTVLNQF